MIIIYPEIYRKWNEDSKGWTAFSVGDDPHHENSEIFCVLRPDHLKGPVLYYVTVLKNMEMKCTCKRNELCLHKFIVLKGIIKELIDEEMEEIRKEGEG